MVITCQNGRAQANYFSSGKVGLPVEERRQVMTGVNLKPCLDCKGVLGKYMENGIDDLTRKAGCRQQGTTRGRKTCVMGRWMME
jgi:hypothetical protein